MRNSFASKTQTLPLKTINKTYKHIQNQEQDSKPEKIHKKLKGNKKLHNRKTSRTHQSNTTTGTHGFGFLFI